MKFNDKLVQLRREKGYSQEQLADILNVSRQSVSKWEAGQSMPELNKLIVIADRFGVTMDQLVRDDFDLNQINTEQVTSDHSKQPIVYQQNYYGCYEYKSKREIFGIPLVHIKTGYGIQVARGIIAIGNISFGVISLGGLGIGCISFGGVSLGLLLSLGGFALGGMALGGVAIGIIAAGATAIGMYSFGAVAIASKLAIGASASGATAIGVKASGDHILTITENITNAQIRDFILERHPHLWKPLLKLLTFFL